MTAIPAQAPWRIALISSMILTLELALIRQVPAEVRAISYFTNLMFMAAFSGMGIGCILQKQRSMAWTLPLGLLLVFGFVMVGRGIVIHADAAEVHYFLQYPNLEGGALKLPLFEAAALIFLFGAFPFVAMGQALARSMDSHPRLVAYGWDIAGSVAGTVLFALGSLLLLPPWIWPMLVGLMWAGLFERGLIRRIAFCIPGGLFALLAFSPQTSTWSPYYYVQQERSAEGLHVFVNSSFHQLAIDFTDETPENRHMQETMLDRWSRAYRMYAGMHDGEPPRRVLILGAGTGNDVHVAHVNGASEIVAVEIDPVILQLGIEENPTRPYDHPGVRTVVDDARHFLRTSDQRFDMIVFGTLDSQALLSSYTNLRLENYVYTREALQDAHRLLEDRGMVVLFYSVFRPWLYSRIYTTVHEAFGDQSMIYFDRQSFLFNTVIVATKGEESFAGRAESIEKYGRGLASTDDWPFIYLERPTIAPIYLQLLGVVALVMLCAFGLLRRLHRVRGLYANFLLLGLGFTLMESSAIVRLALVFGSTWIVNAVVFSSVLTMVWFANYTVLRGMAPPMKLAWIGLGVSILANWAFPLELFFEVAAPFRVLGCSVLIGVPVYCAAVCFSRLFERVSVTGYALGINLIGAMGGGLIEYISMAVGLRAVWLVALGVYALAWGFSTLSRGETS
ncbi:MAG: hypothetical protein GY725_07720 [bacterium]|nr:hypothetical protein [bacterium]